jgi:hypothetical protein
MRAQELPESMGQPAGGCWTGDGCMDKRLN